MLKPIILIRHGSTKDNGAGAQDKIRGWKDVPLDDRGKIEAQQAARDCKGLKLAGLVSSDLSRAKETAMIISRMDDIKLISVSPYFRPWNLGIYTGVESEQAAPDIQKYATQMPQTPVPKGESFHDFERRFFKGLKMVCGHPGLIGIVSHYRCICLLESWKSAGFPPDGSIDHEKFCRKGEPPGHVKEFDVPTERIP